MSVSFRVDRERGIVRGTAEGVVGADDLIRYVDDLADSDAVERDMPRLIDLQHTFLDVTADDCWQIVNRVRHRGLGPTRLAIVVSDDHSHSIARMYATIAINAHLHAEVFYDVEQAERWLLAGQRSGARGTVRESDSDPAD